MSVTVVCVGKLSESYYADAANEYRKRLTRLMPVAVCEVASEREPSPPSAALSKRAIEREGERVMARIPGRAHVIALCVGARQLSSEELAERLRGLLTAGRDICFVIGGSMGLSEGVLRRADERLGMSLMTFPHQLARVMLMEQLYRAAKINAGERYHK